MRSNIRSNARRSSSRNFVFITSPVQNPQPTSSSVRCFLGLRVEACHATGPSLGQPNNWLLSVLSGRRANSPPRKSVLIFCPAHLHSRRIARDASCPFLPSTNRLERLRSSPLYFSLRRHPTRVRSFLFSRRFPPIRKVRNCRVEPTFHRAQGDIENLPDLFIGKLMEIG